MQADKHAVEDLQHNLEVPLYILKRIITLDYELI